MKISLIISTCNKAIYLDIALFSIVNTNKLYDIDIVIIDDGSNDNTKRVVEKYKNDLNIAYVYQENRGLSTARNKGISYSKSEYLLFLDDDRVLAKDYFDNIIIPSKNQVIVGKRKEIYVRDIAKNIDFFKEKISMDYDYIDKRSLNERYYNKTKELINIFPNYIPWIGCTFSNTLISKKTFEKVGYFDENFTGWGFEDLELAYRLHKENISFATNEKMCNTHIFHSHSKNILEQRARNYAWFCEKHPDYAIFLYNDFIENKVDALEYNKLVSKSK